MNMEEFKTILERGTAEIEEKKSRFIADIFYIENSKQAEEKIKEVKKKYFDAKHHCYVYRVIENNAIKEKQSDDGEPSGTAGAPMLNILNKNGFANVLIVVTRYFGGTLLGTGGLIRAYSEATLKVINESKIVKQKMGYEMKVVIPYKELEKFKYYCNKKNIYIKNLIYESNIICVVEINNEEKENLISKSQKEIEILESTVLMEKYIRVNNE
mgnify:FL=1